MENFEEQLRKDLHQFLLSMKEVDDVSMAVAKMWGSDPIN